MVPDFLHEAPPTKACAAFIKESRMEYVNARELNRKSGCTLVRTWGTRPEERGFVLCSNFHAADGPAANATAPASRGKARAVGDGDV